MENEPISTSDENIDDDLTVFCEIPLKVSDKIKTKEEYYIEANIFYRSQIDKNKDNEISKLRNHLNDFFRYEYENLDISEQTYTNVDGIIYDERYIKLVIDKISKSTIEMERYFYYKRLLFLETWKWNSIKITNITTTEIMKFCKSPEYRKWKISKLLGY